ncbi:hypothetical protein [Mesorhizobium sp.]|uniref:hypothetical protein n=1 Tax=Mesorhizobium sp. TaxID=1871066 RepID=UPI0025FA5F85|nr:hypothetical protein [Mesorhizobium sp.]
MRTPEALVERLDNGACQGCHQAGSTAGFHFIGLDDKTTSPLNRIEVGISPHLHAEMPRREAWLRATVEGKEPNRLRPLSFAPPAAWQDTGEVAYVPAEVAMPCLMPEDAKHFAAGWQRGGGTVCTVLATASGVRTKLAQCLLPKDSEKMFSGHPCLTGLIASNVTKPFNDRYSITGQLAAFATDISRTAYTCRPPKIGVPAGIAYRGCNDKDRAFAGFKPGKTMPNEICGLVGGKKFDICVATNNFDQCLDGAVNRGNRPACWPIISAARIICASRCRPIRLVAARWKVSASARRPILSSRCASTIMPRRGRAPSARRRARGSARRKRSELLPWLLSRHQRITTECCRASSRGSACPCCAACAAHAQCGGGSNAA